MDTATPSFEYRAVISHGYMDAERARWLRRAGLHGASVAHPVTPPRAAPQ